MDKGFAIFDMDGTLVDSMACWQRLAGEYLACKGVEGVSPEILKRIKPMTMTGSAALFIQEFGLEGTPETVAGEMNALMDDHYRRDIPLKPGAAAYLEGLHARGVRMCVASAAAESLMETCLKRLGVLKYFEFLLSCETVGAGKDKPDVYHACADRFGAGPGEIAVYEDALYAAETAKKAGYYVVGVYDHGAAAHWEELMRLSDAWVRSWE